MLHLDKAHYAQLWLYFLTAYIITRKLYLQFCLVAQKLHILNAMQTIACHITKNSNYILRFMDCGRLMCIAPQFLHGETFQVAIATQKTFLHLTDVQNVDSHQGFVNLWKWTQRV